MKWSNFGLAIVAVLAMSASVLAARSIIETTPTAVISVTEPGVQGGGFSIPLPKNLTPRQAEVLNLAYKIAKEDGHKQPQLLQGIVLQETRAGEMKSYAVAGQEFGLKTNDRYYGLAQIKLAAAKDVLARYPALRTQFNFHTNADEEIIAKLIEDDRFNLSVASKYLLVLRAAGFDTIQQLALAYNQGPGGAKAHDASTFHYSVGVMKNMQKLKS